MAAGLTVMAFYTSRPLDGLVEDTYTACEQAGFEVDQTSEETDTIGENEYYRVYVRYEGWSFDFSFNTAEDRPPGEPALSVSCGQNIYPSKIDDSTDYPDLMDGILELFCRLAMTLDVDYAPLFNSRNHAVVPEGQPISEAVEETPPMGIYSEAVLEQFGGVEAMGKQSPWYAADLDGGLTLVVESAEPWQNDGWQPPTKTPYLSNASFADADPDSEPDSPGFGFADPFAALAPGEYGTEVGIAREDTGKDFTNENLQLVRVRVGDDGNLRRIKDDSFVRNVVADAANDVAAIGEMFGDVPSDACEDEQVVSALFRDIPPSFVRLDEPDDENVITKVMALDVKTSKYTLLTSLGRDAQRDDFTAEERKAMEAALENLAGLGDVGGIEEYIEKNLL